MPKWIVYCQRCNRPSAYSKIDPANPDLAANLEAASPTIKKPSLPAEGDKWECPFCKKESRVKHCDLTFSYA